VVLDACESRPELDAKTGRKRHRWTADCMKAIHQVASLRTFLSLQKKHALPSRPGLCKHAVITSWHTSQVRDKLASFAFVPPNTFSVTGASTRVYSHISTLLSRPHLSEKHVHDSSRRLADRAKARRGHNHARLYSSFIAKTCPHQTGKMSHEGLQKVPTNPTTDQDQ
jgi:hypothetical protein